jgi:hypothetical protein
MTLTLDDLKAITLDKRESQKTIIDNIEIKTSIFRYSRGTKRIDRVDFYVKHENDWKRIPRHQLERVLAGKKIQRGEAPILETSEALDRAQRRRRLHSR